MDTSPIKDLTGTRQGKLTVISWTGKRSHANAAIWLFRCDCGKEFERVYRKSIQSCGCANTGRFRGQDLTGKRFGKVTITGDSGNRNAKGYILWTCHCDCGNDFERASYAFHRNTCKMCPECFRQASSERVITSPPRKGYTKNGEWQKTLDNDFGRWHPIHRLCSRYKHNAAQRNLAFELSKNQVYEITSQPCHYCGQFNEGHLSGIDRVDSSGGYTQNNVVPCCVICNRAKSKMDTDDFKDWIRRAYEKMFT